ncbi:MAG TPA: hypothetical protein PK256_21235, partial [Verrucomicrobiota bacterium]|nr:hypothetical protein [Verrucomicrobiota bacterium]
MRHIAILFIFWGFALSLAAADYVNVYESYEEKAVQIPCDCAVARFEKQQKDVFTLTASLTLEGLSEEEIDDYTYFEFFLNTWESLVTFSATLGQADVKTNNKWIYFFDFEDFVTGEIIELGRASFTRRGDTIDMVYTVTESVPTFAMDHWDMAGPFEEQMDFYFTFGFLDKSATVYYKGKTDLSTVTMGKEGEEETFDLANVTLSGRADFTKPTMGFVVPKANLKTTSDRIMVTVTARDNVGVDSVGIRSDPESDYTDMERMEGSSQWTAEVDLAPGTNVLEALCRDWAGNERIESIKVVYEVTSPIEIVANPADGGKVTGLRSGQMLQEGRFYTVTAVASRGYVFAGWRGGMASAEAALTFRMEEGMLLEALFIPNPFIPLAGIYRGLFAPASSSSGNQTPMINPSEPGGTVGSGMTPDNCGAIELSINRNGQASGVLMLGGQSLYLRQVLFDIKGAARITVERRGSLPPLDLSMQLDLGNPKGVLSGTVKAGGTSMHLLAFLGQAAETWAGRYTAVIPGGPSLQPQNNSSLQTTPDGDGIATIEVDPSGDLDLSGNLGDGTAFDIASGVSFDGLWPVYASLYDGKGLLFGWVRFLRNAGAPEQVRVDGPILWIKPPSTSSNPDLYPRGFAVRAVMSGARYEASLATGSAWNWDQGVIELAGGNLSQPLRYAVDVEEGSLVIAGNDTRMSASVSERNGWVSGSFYHPDLRKRVSFRGIVVQWPNRGFEVGGWFRGEDQSGHVFMGPDVEKAFT